MEILLVGLNHRTAPVALREQLSLAGCGVRLALKDLRQSQRSPAGAPVGESNGRSLKTYVHESVILSTCNRLELYAVTSGTAAEGFRRVETFLAKLQGVALEKLHPHLYFLEGDQAVVHLLRVASGLDSMILGEPQILGQVSAALAEAQGAGAAGPVLSHLFEQAAHAGKRARTETDIGRHTTSIGHAAAQLVHDQIPNLALASGLIIGAGDMAQIATKALQQHGLGKATFINRTYARAESLARRFQGQPLNWSRLSRALVEADVVVSATGAPHTVVHAQEVLSVLPERKERPLLFVDIAVPRDVEEEVGELAGVRRYDIDHLQSVVDENLAQRKAAVPGVEEIVAQEAERFSAWLQGRQVVPVLVALRQKAREIADAELERSLHHLETMPREQQQKVTQMVHRIVNKLLHEPTVRLKSSAARAEGFELAHAASDLFALDNTSTTLEIMNTRSKNGANHARLAEAVGGPQLQAQPGMDGDG